MNLMRAAESSAHLDPARLAELHRLRLLDTPAEVPFDRLTRLAARVLGAPMAMVSLIDERRQFLKSTFGLPEPLSSIRETPLHVSICKSVVQSGRPLIICDAQSEQSITLHPDLAVLNIVAYLGIPLITENGFTLGSFCVIDTMRRDWTDEEQHTMNELAACVMSEISLRFAYDELHAGNQALQKEASEREHLLRALQDSHDALRAAQLRATARGSLLNRDQALPTQSQTTEPASLVDADDAVSKMRALLTKRQLEVFDLLLRGLQTKDVARKLKLSHRTIDVHRAKILQRLHVNSFHQVMYQLMSRNS
jgi:GAF domain-containing protein